MIPYDHDINCGIHDDPGFSQCTCGFDPTLPFDEAKVFGAAIAMVILMIVLAPVILISHCQN